MKRNGNIKIVLSWEDTEYRCWFQRGDEDEDWGAMTRDEQVRAVGAMVTMSEMLKKMVKEAE